MTVSDVSVTSESGMLVRVVWRPVVGLVKFIVGAFFCLTPFSAILVLGWLMRKMRRDMVLVWMREGRQGDVSLNYRYWPNWFRGQAAGEGSIFYNLAGSFAENLKAGLSSFFSLALMTAPYGSMLLVFWWAGWNNSFLKGYEQAAVGPAATFIGIFLLIATMSYLPLATAHQASVSGWRGFFDYKSVFAVIYRKPVSWFWLSVLWFLASLPILGYRALPVIVAGQYPDFFEQSPEAIEQFRGFYVLGGAAYVFAALLILRRSAARIYAKAAFRLAYEGGTAFKVSSWQKGILGQQHIENQGKGVYGGGGVLLRKGLVSLAMCAGSVVWFGFYFQILTGQFLNHSWLLWVQHPLVLLPWLVPPGAG